MQPPIAHVQVSARSQSGLRAPTPLSIIMTIDISASEPNGALQEALTLAELLDRHGHSLWGPGSHKMNVFSFILEANEILLSRQLRSFELSDLEQIQAAWRRHGNSVATINRKTMALSKLLRAAHKAGAVSTIPEFHKLEEPPERIRFLNNQEEDSLFAHIRSLSKDYYDLSIVLVDTGAKVGEIIDLRWADIPHDASTLRLSRDKGRYDRTIPTTARIAAVLTPMQRTQEGPFCTIQQYKYRAAWNEAKVRAGLGNDEGVVPYVLRHTCASRLVQEGVDLRRVQLWLGHRTLQMTMKYDYLSTNNLDICASVLDARRG